MAPVTASLVAEQDRLRTRFPSLSGDQIFLENAGGSQVPKSVPDRMHQFMLEAYVQTGAGYPASALATETFSKAHAFANTLMNGDGIGSTVIQPSCSQAVKHLAESWSYLLNKGNEIVVAQNGHEANIGAWLKLDRFGVKTVWWEVDRDFGDLTLDGLSKVLTDRTRLVVFPHTSNLLGYAIDVAEATRIAHDAGAKVVVDGVAFAPHHAPDVKAWGCDWYVFSWYKVFGPHVAAMFGRHEAWEGLTGPNHVFIPKVAMPYKQTLGCPSYEAMAGLLGTQEYLRFAAGAPKTEGPMSRTEAESASGLFQACERAPLARLLDFLNSKSTVRIVGQPAISAHRVGIVSFVTSKSTPKLVAAVTDSAGIGIKTGHMYSFRLCEALGIDTEQGVIRVSLAHYNTVEEIERLIQILDPIV
ncbi:MAG: aminotransferase class V-fold PLP-dependent enzyme [Armatimonadetes bacterium]|nr:aminotransferase class V-fold PLP-dependent enzyme [Armatimonadota bacterium]